MMLTFEIFALKSPSTLDANVFPDLTVDIG